MSYNAIAMVTDYDCWKDDTEAVDAQHVLKVIKGQLISKCPYEKSVSSKIPTKKFPRFLP